MTEEKYQVKFQKWKNPYIPDNEGNIQWPVDDEDFIDEEDEKFWQEYEKELDGLDELEHRTSVPMKAIMTQGGIIPLLEHSMPEKVFKMWVGHTKFRLTTDLLEAIDNTDGVEAWSQITPYRFRVAFAKLFKDREVMLELKKNLVQILQR